MSGGLGNDLYVVDDMRDKVIEGANAGDDTVKTDLEKYALSAEVENLPSTLKATPRLQGTARTTP
jgi:hypothetical protein